MSEYIDRQTVLDMVLKAEDGCIVDPIRQDWRPAADVYKLAGKITNIPAVDVKSAPKWVSVKDREPERSANWGFLAYLDNDEIEIAASMERLEFYDGTVNHYNISAEYCFSLMEDAKVMDKELWREVEQDGERVYVKVPKIIYWMPLPEPPKEDNNG